MSQKRDEMFKSAEFQLNGEFLTRPPNTNEFINVKVTNAFCEGLKQGYDSGWLHALLHDERVLALVEVLDDCANKFNSWKDKGHVCQSKVDLQSITDAAREALTQYRESVK